MWKDNLEEKMKNEKKAKFKKYYIVWKVIMISISRPNLSKFKKYYIVWKGL